MKRTSIKYAGILFLIVMISCAKNSNRDFIINYMMREFEKKFGICDTLGGNCAKISLEYPEIKTAINDQVKDSLSKFIENSLLENYSNEKKSKSIDEMAELFFKDYGSTQNELDGYNIPWEINNTISINYNANSIVSFQSEFYLFTGGAHGISGTYYTNFNSQDGNKLSLSNLLIPNYEPELNNIAEKIFRKVKEISPEANLEEEGFWFEGNKFSLNANFGIKNNGLVFFFNSYEIAPYAMGTTEIFVSFAEIKKLINQDGLLFKLTTESN